MTNKKNNIRDACISIEQLRKIQIGSRLHPNHYVGTFI